MPWISRAELDALHSRMFSLEKDRAMDRERFGIGQTLYASYKPKIAFLETCIDRKKLKVPVADVVRMILDHLNLRLEHIEGTDSTNVLAKKGKLK
jgi:hypothetical protein